MLYKRPVWPMTNSWRKCPTSPRVHNYYTLNLNTKSVITFSGEMKWGALQKRRIKPFGRSRLTISKLSRTRQPPPGSHSSGRAGSKPGWGESRVTGPTGHKIPTGSWTPPFPLPPLSFEINTELRKDSEQGHALGDVNRRISRLSDAIISPS